MHLWQTLRTNWRDITAFTLIWVGISLLADIVTRLSALGSDPLGLANMANRLQGFASFAGASLCTWLLGIAVAWPTLNRWGLTSWTAAWNSLSPKEQFFTFMGVACATLIAAALCFSGR